MKNRFYLLLVALCSSKEKQEMVIYKANDHHGTLREPVLLAPMDNQQPVKILENGQLYILMPDGTRYSATGKKVN